MKLPEFPKDHILRELEVPPITAYKLFCELIDNIFEVIGVDPANVDKDIDITELVFIAVYKKDLERLHQITPLRANWWYYVTTRLFAPPKVNITDILNGYIDLIRKGTDEEGAKLLIFLKAFYP